MLIFDEIIEGFGRTGNILTLRLAEVITREEMDRAIDIIDEAIGQVEQGKKY